MSSQKVDPATAPHHSAPERDTERDTGGPAASHRQRPQHLLPHPEDVLHMLNTLSSNMSQLHGKVDLLSLEVSRIKQSEPH